MVSGLLETDDLLMCEFAENGEGPHYYNCWNLCREVYRRAGLILPAYDDYIKDVFKRDAVIRDIRKCFFKELAGPERLSIVTLMMRPGCVTHMGVVLEKNRFIHIGKRTGVVIARLDDRRWKKRIEGFYRYVSDSGA